MKPTPIDGDCWPCCISHLFDVPFETVAHLSWARSPDDWIENTESWLAERGLFSLSVAASPDRRWPFHQVPDNILAIACGTSEPNPERLFMRFHFVSRRRRESVFGRKKLREKHEPHDVGQWPEWLVNRFLLNRGCIAVNLNHNTMTFAVFMSGPQIASDRPQRAKLKAGKQSRDRSEGWGTVWAPIHSLRLCLSPTLIL